MLLKEKRLAKGMLQKDVAFALGISVSSISLYESGRRKPSIDILTKMSIFFDCTIDELVKGEKC